MILNINYKQKSIAVLNIQSPYGISFFEEKSTIINQENGKSYITSCINCINARCMNLNDEEIKCNSFSSMSHDMNLNVCPVDAIKSGEQRIEINQEKCIGCGMCVQRCPVGALHIRNSKATHNINANVPRKEMEVNDKNINIQEDFLIQQVHPLQYTIQQWRQVFFLFSH